MTARASVDRLDALDDDRPVPGVAQPAEVGDGDRRVEHAVDEVGDRALGLAEGRESQRFGREQVEPPARDAARCRTSVRTRQRRRDREAVVDVAEPRAGDRRVDGQDERAEAGGAGAPHQVDRRRRGRSTGRAGTTCSCRVRPPRRPRARSCPGSTARTGCPAGRRPARPPARPSWFISRVKPVGAKTSGSADGRPRIVVEGSTCDTSWSTLGTNSTRANASRERRRLVSVSAAPST